MEKFTLDKQLHDLTIEYMKAHNIFSIPDKEKVYKEYNDTYNELLKARKELLK